MCQRNRPPRLEWMLPSGLPSGGVAVKDLAFFIPVHRLCEEERALAGPAGGAMGHKGMLCIQTLSVQFL